MGPFGGSTVLISGSARRMRLLREPVPRGGEKLKELLAEEAQWFADIFGIVPTGNQQEQLLAHSADGEAAFARTRRLLAEDGQISMGIHMRMVELTGAPGDIVLWDPR